MPFDHFSIIAGFYDKFGHYRISEPLLGLLSLSPNSLVLDAGGGTGRVAAVLRSMVQEVFVVDISPGMLRRATGKGLTTVCAPVESLPFLSGSIDRIIMMDALHHVINQCQTAHELWRVLTPGGRILIIEPNIHKLSAKVIAIGEKLLLMRSHFLAGEEIASLFKFPQAKTEVFFYRFNVFFIAEKVREL